MKLPTIKPPITLDKNATVYFDVPTGAFKVAARTRNKIPVTTESSVDVYITEIGDRFLGQDSPGLNTTDKRVRGYFLVDKFPNGLRSQNRVRVSIDTNNGSETYTLFFSERTTPLKDIIINSLGIPFEGYIQSIGGAG